jgi:hypothetical protein
MRERRRVMGVDVVGEGAVMRTRNGLIYFTEKYIRSY